MDITQFFRPDDLIGILPHGILLITALGVLTMEMWAHVFHRWMLWTGLAGIFFTLLVTLKNLVLDQRLFGGMIVIDLYSSFFDILYLGVGASALVLSSNYLERKGSQSRGEYFALILFGVLGMMLMTQANDLIIVFLGLELLSLSLYILVGFLRQDIYSNESGVKYLLLGAFATGFFLFGTALVYGATGSTNFENIASVPKSAGVASVTSGVDLFSELLRTAGIGLIFVGFAFKVAIAPFHMWSPDVYQGAPTPVTAFLCTAPKAAGFGALIKVFLTAFSSDIAFWQDLMWILSVLTMTIGNISALVQSNVKRMLAFSSVAHAGYLAMALGVMDETSVSSVLLYLIVYSAMNLGAFGIVSLMERENLATVGAVGGHADSERSIKELPSRFIPSESSGSEKHAGKGTYFEDYKGLASRHPGLSALLALFMISLAGFPPTAGFVAKYALFSSVLAEGYLWLVIIAILNTLLSVPYYIRLVVNMYMSERSPEESVKPEVGWSVTILLIILAAVMLFFGLFPGLLIDFSTNAVKVIS